VTHTYWSDRWKPLEERIGSSTTASRSYLWGERPGHRDELVLRDRDTDGNGSLVERLYATMDYFNGTAILNTSGVVQERYAYNAFGVRRIMAADFTPRSTSSHAWDFGFQGQFRDVETGWYNYGYRFYVPLLGRWINRDPIGVLGGANLFGMLQNNPVNDSDYLGLQTTANPLGIPLDKGAPDTNCSSYATCSSNDKTFHPNFGDKENGFELLNPEFAGCKYIGNSGSADNCEGTDIHIIIFIDPKPPTPPPMANSPLPSAPPALIPSPSGRGREAARYHVIGEDHASPGTYRHQAGEGGTQHVGVTDPSTTARNYFDATGRPVPRPVEAHYCCPCKTT
jgi:RHS repeat-associated protein